MKKLPIIITLILLLAACSPTPTMVSSSPIPNTNIQTPEPANPMPQSDTPTASTESTPTLAAAQQPAGSLQFQVTSPLDEAIVNTPQVEVIGSAPTGAVVSVNDEIILVGDEGQFKATVVLDEGPNLIEVVVSDVDGNESSLLLTVTYEP